jgi:hypothetical protein
LSRAAAAIGAVLAALPLVTACESTQEKSAKIGREARKLVSERGLVVGRRNPEVRVVATTALHDANGTAVVVVLRNRSKRPLAALPLAINVRGARGRSLFKNDAPGLQPSLVQAALLPPHGELEWVNDQVQTASTPRSVAARVGMAPRPAPAALPRLTVSRVRLEADPVSGIAAVGRVENHSKLDQRKLVVFVVARRHGRVVAAGRGLVQRLRPGKSGAFKVFFIGDPRGARLNASAPPTSIGQARR